MDKTARLRSAAADPHITLNLLKLNVQKRKGARALALAVLLCAGCAHGVPAFPGAEGFGANALGGRGGDVYYVTNLEDDGQGSLRHGIDSARGPRTVLFNVSGTIRLRSRLEIDKPRITIAGQTAPGDGICLADYPLIINADDIVIRHIRSRLGTRAGQEEDSITISGGSNIILDHCSASWSVDETLSVVGRAQHVTVQWCYITESLADSIHTKGAHGYASLIRPRQDASYTFHHNLFAHHTSRSPRPGTYGGKLLRLDFVNNVIYNWGSRAGYNNFPEERVEMNYAGNYLVAGPSTTWFRSAFDSSGTNTQIFQSDNRFDVNTNGIADGIDSGWKMFSGTFTKMDAPFPSPPIAMDPADVALQRVLTQGGALPWRRDAADVRVTATVRKQTGKIINTTEEVGGWPELRSLAPPTDTDGDGMPDFWELAMGLDPSVKDNNEDPDGDGYTNLEDYLNWLAQPHAIGRRGTPVEIDLRALTGQSDTLKFNVASATGGRVSLKDGFIARFVPDKDFVGLARFSFTAIDTKTEVSGGLVTVGILITQTGGQH
jgi:pectate lyase